MTSAICIAAEFAPRWSAGDSSSSSTPTLGIAIPIPRPATNQIGYADQPAPIGRVMTTIDRHAADSNPKPPRRNRYRGTSG